MNGSGVSNGTRPSPINTSHRSFRDFPRFLVNGKRPGTQLNSESDWLPQTHV